MKNIHLTILTAIILLCLSVPLKAQVSVSLNFNIGSQPVWGPVGYDAVEYYYLPDIEVYYYVPQHVFYFNDGGRWVSVSSLPSRYRDYDLYKSYKVVVTEREPWRHHKNYKEKYFSYRNRHDQKSIRDSRDSKYFVNKNHPEHNKWKNNQKQEKGNVIKNSNEENQKYDKGNVSKQSKGNDSKHEGSNGKGKNNKSGKK